MKLGKLLALNPNIKGLERDEVEFQNFGILFEHLAEHAKDGEKASLQIKAEMCKRLSEVCKILQDIKH